MIANVKKYLLHLLCVVALLGGMTACEGFNINWGDGNGDGTGTGTGTGNENGNENGHENGNENGNDENAVALAGCWHLVELNGADVDVDIYIDFGKESKFVIYQRTESLEFTVFKGTYNIDEENSIVSGVYNDGTSWLCDYSYVVENDRLTLTNVDNTAEVAVYEASEVPASATANTRSASVNDVKPL